MGPTRVKRVFYAAAGGADLISTHLHWSSGIDNPDQVSLTFSGQVQDFCRGISAQAYFLSVHPKPRKLQDGSFSFEHRPKKKAGGISYHLREIAYGIGMLRTARKFRADLALLDSGTTHYFVMWLFPLFGIPVVPILHNALWARGFRPRRPVQRAVQWLNSLFFKRAPLAVIAVSPEVERQVRELSPHHETPIFQMLAQFQPEHFMAIPPPPPHDRRPFRILFVGRIIKEKGALDIPIMARRIEDCRPGLVKWIICGDGPDFGDLQKAVATEGVGHVVDVRGWTSPAEQRSLYASSHAAIVPTRSSFAEGLAMTAVEAILAGRPLVSNPVVPALEMLSPAALTAATDDPISHADAVLKLATDPGTYERLCLAAAQLQHPFYDRRNGLAAVLHTVVADRFACSASFE